MAVHGAEYDIRQLVRDERAEGGTNQAMLGRLSKRLGSLHRQDVAGSLTSFDGAANQ